MSSSRKQSGLVACAGLVLFSLIPLVANANFDALPGAPYCNNNATNGCKSGDIKGSTLGALADNIYQFEVNRCTAYVCPPTLIKAPSCVWKQGWQCLQWNMTIRFIVGPNQPFDADYPLIASWYCPPGSQLYTNYPGAYWRCTGNPPAVWPVVNKNLGEQKCAIQAGNPVNTATGNKFQRETDYRSSGAQPLEWVRHYNSTATGAPGSINLDWRGTYDRRVVVGQSSSASVEVWRADGKGITFAQSGSNWIPDADIDDRLTGSAATGWTYTTSDDTVETYDTSGKLTSITQRTGLTQTLAYDGSGRLSTVADGFGRTLTFTYDATNRLATMTDPAGGVYTYAYDASNNLASVTYPDSTPADPSDNPRRVYHYNEAVNINGGTACAGIANGFPNALTGITDENGARFATYQYDCQGRAISTEHAGGAERFALSYNTDGTTTVTDALNTARTYGFQTILGVVKNTAISQPCSSCGGSSSATSYDANGNVASRTDFNGNTTTYTYDLTRNLETSRTEAAGTPQARTITTQWHASFRLPAQIDAPNQRTTFTYDSVGRLLTRTETATDVTPNLSRIWTYTWNTTGALAGLPATVNGPRTDVTDLTTYTYYTDTTATHRMGDLWKVTNALGHVTEITSYDAHGRPLSITDPNGAVSALGYDARGRLIARTVEGALTTFNYDAVGNLTGLIEPDGSTLAYTYDAAHRLTGIADGQGNHIDYTLDAMGNRTREDTYDPADTLKRTRSRVYNGLNQLVQDLGGVAGQTTSYGYDDNGNLTSITDPLNHITGESYDALNRLVQVNHPDNAATQYAYNAQDRHTTVTDPKGLITSYSYNGLGDLLTQASPDTGTTIYTYDSGGNVKTKKDARNKTTTYTYDALNRLTQTKYGDNTTTAYTYDTGTYGKGRLVSMTDPGSITTTWTYDHKGRVTGKTQRIGTASRTVAYAYNGADRITAITYPSGRVLSYTYNAGLITTVKIDSTVIASGIAYQPFAEVAAWTWGNGSAYGRTYDLDGRLTSYPLGSASRSVGYDAASNIIAMQDPVMGVKSYGYDAMDRLNYAAAGSLIQGYAYDSNGNRSRYDEGMTSYPYSYASTNHRLQSIAGPVSRTYSYDAAGNITGNGVHTYTYNARGRMSQSQSVAAGTFNYLVNGLEQRVRKAGSSTTVFLRDEAGRVLGEYAANGAVQKETFHLGEQPLAVRDASSTYYAYADQLNTPRAIATTANTTLWRWEAEPFGGNLPNEDVDGNGALFKYHLRYPGQYYDSETGLHYNYFRDYDPGIGRYIQSDPIGLAGGINTYSYVDNNPLSYTDPLGLWAWGDPVDQRIVDAVAGFGSGVSLGVTNIVSDYLGQGNQVNQCSDAYRVGSLAAFTLGAGRLAYAGLAKGISITASSGAAASAGRSQLRTLFGGGGSLRPPNLAKYTTDAELRAAAGRTNPFANLYGAGVAAKGALGACGCQ